MPQKTTFVPQLIIGHGITDISFYIKAFGAKELQRWIAELEIDGTMFHLDQEIERNNNISPQSANGTTVIVGLMVDMYMLFLTELWRQVRKRFPR